MNNIDEIIKILKENEKIQIQLIQQINIDSQKRLNDIENNFKRQMNQITNELNLIKGQNLKLTQQIDVSFNILKQKVNSIYQNIHFYPQIQNVNYYIYCYHPNFYPDSEIGKLIFDGVKAILMNLLKNNLSEQEKAELELCNDIIETFDSNLNLKSPNSSDFDQAKAIVKVAELLNKYFA